jgi:hypothetical protein
MDLSIYKTSKDATVEDVELRIKELEKVMATTNVKTNKGHHLLSGHLEVNKAVLEALKSRKKIRRYRWSQ